MTMSPAEHDRPSRDADRVRLPADIDLDKLFGLASVRVNLAIAEWLSGVPKDESALMNRLTARLKRKGRCDVGTKKKMVVSSSLRLLHREEDDATDAHGVDLAVTIRCPSGQFVKTALLQLKAGNEFKATLSRRQLKDATKDPDFRDRSFVFYADKDRPGVRIIESLKALEKFDDEQKEKVFHTTKWMPLCTWLIGWLSCDIGPASDWEDENSIERKLDRFEASPTIKDRHAELIHEPTAWLETLIRPRFL